MIRLGQSSADVSAPYRAATGGIGLYLMLPSLAQHDQPDLGSGSTAMGHRRTKLALRRDGLIRRWRSPLLFRSARSRSESLAAADPFAAWANHCYRFAGVKNRERNSRSPNTRPISLNEKYGISARERIIMTKRNAFGLPFPICGKLSPIVFPLNLPTTSSSIIKY